MDVALCYPSVLPGRGGCETYIADLSRRLAKDGHGVHIFASTWDASALPASTHFHRVEATKGPRFLRPWRFAAACEQAMKLHPCDVSIGFDKTWGQDILYPQGGLHAATAWHNRLKHSSTWGRRIASLGKSLDPANWSYHALEKKQYFGERKPNIVVNSEMVAGHFEQFYGVPRESLTVIRSAIDPGRFAAEDRLKRRFDQRQTWKVSPEQPVGLFVGMNYRLKGLEPLLRALPAESHLVVAGGSNFAKYERLAKTLGKNVHFLGHVRDPRDLYFAADYLVHPTFYDPCSLVVLEALACGLPVVTTRYNGASELLDAKTGIVVNDPHEANELASAIRTVSQPAFLKVGAPAARAAANRWTFEQHYQALTKLFVRQQGLRKVA